MPVISGGVVQGPGRVLFHHVYFTEAAANDAAGTYSASVTIPAYSFLLDIVVYGEALWDSGSAVALIAGDTQSGGSPDDNGFIVSTDLKATDLLAGEGIALSGGTALAGGKVGADIANSQFNRRLLSVERTVTLTVTMSGASGSAGRTRAIVIYTDPVLPINATFTAS